MATDINTRYAQAVALQGDGFRAFVAQSTKAPALPSRTPQGQPTEEVASVDDAVRELTQHAEQSRSELRFQVDNELGRVIVTIVDKSSGDVLMQIPGEEALRIARMLRHRDHGLIETVA